LAVKVTSEGSIRLWAHSASLSMTDYYLTDYYSLMGAVRVTCDLF